MYTSSNGLEQRIPPDTLRYISKKAEPDSFDPMKLMADASYQFPVDFPFSYSNVINYAEIKMPRKLNHLIKI